jgi:hypothetical protein
MLQLLRKYVRLPAVERRLLIEAFGAVAAFRLLLWLCPFRRVIRLGRSVRSTGEIKPAPPVGWAVEAAARRLPAASCLTRALAARWLLARRGVSSSLRFGWRADPRQGFQAHAWLVAGRDVVVGHQENLTAYYPFEEGVPAEWT